MEWHQRVGCRSRSRATTSAAGCTSPAAIWRSPKARILSNASVSAQPARPARHVAIDDHSRLAYAEVRPSDRQGDALAFLERARAWFRAQGIAVQAVMTDNGPAYRSHAWRQHCAAHDLRHLRTRPYTPRTNGKAERFIQILLHRWAYAFAYPSSAHRTRALIGWLRWYNRRRPHGSLDGLPPVSRVSHLRGQYI